MSGRAGRAGGGEGVMVDLSKGENSGSGHGRLGSAMTLGGGGSNLFFDFDNMDIPEDLGSGR